MRRPEPSEAPLLELLNMYVVSNLFCQLLQEGRLRPGPVEHIVSFKVGLSTSIAQRITARRVQGPHRWLGSSVALTQNSPGATCVGCLLAQGPEPPPHSHHQQSQKVAGCGNRQERLLWCLSTLQ